MCYGLPCVANCIQPLPVIKLRFSSLVPNPLFPKLTVSLSQQTTRSFLSHVNNITRSAYFHQHNINLYTVLLFTLKAIHNPAPPHLSNLLHIATPSRTLRSSSFMHPVYALKSSVEMLKQRNTMCCCTVPSHTGRIKVFPEPS